MDGGFQEYKQVDKKVKIISGKTNEQVDKALSEFKKEHEIINIIQHMPTLVFVFYLG